MRAPRVIYRSYNNDGERAGEENEEEKQQRAVIKLWIIRRKPYQGEVKRTTERIPVMKREKIDLRGGPNKSRSVL